MSIVSLVRRRSRAAVGVESAATALTFLAFGLGTLLLHVLTSGAYGYQRDELYFIECGRHLAWGYVDQPPLIAMVAAFVTTFFGESLAAIRFLPALGAAGTVVLCGLLARRFGAGLAGMSFAMFAVVVAPFFLYVGNLLTMNAFEPLFWLLAALLLVRLLDGEQPQAPLWAGLALVVGIGILNKYTMGFFGVATLFALLALPQRRLLHGWAPLFAIAGIVAIVAPNLWWQHVHGWPQVQLLLHAVDHKDPPLSAPAFIMQQILMVNPATLPLWLAGLWFTWSARGGRYRVFALSYALLLVFFIALHGKVYYLAAIYPVLFAAGAVTLERTVTARAPRIAYACVLTLTAIAIVPQVLPVLPLSEFVKYQRRLDLRHIREENHDVGPIPQQFADMLGWDDFVATLARAYADVPRSERADAALWARNYGLAGAIDVLGPRYGLPNAISGHNNYYLWGTHGYDGRLVLAAGVPLDLLRREFRDIRLVATFHSPWLLPEENDIKIYRCSRPVMPLRRFWPQVKSYV